MTLKTGWEKLSLNKVTGVWLFNTYACYVPDLIWGMLQSVLMLSHYAQCTVYRITIGTLYTLY